MKCFSRLIYSSFPNSKSLPEANSLCGYIEHFNISINNALKFEKKIFKYIIKTHCVRSMAIN